MKNHPLTEVLWSVNGTTVAPYYFTKGRKEEKMEKYPWTAIAKL